MARRAFVGAIAATLGRRYKVIAVLYEAVPVDRRILSEGSAGRDKIAAFAVNPADPSDNILRSTGTASFNTTMTLYRRPSVAAIAPTNARLANEIREETHAAGGYIYASRVAHHAFLLRRLLVCRCGTAGTDACSTQGR